MRVPRISPQQGFSFIEILLVIGLMISISIAAFLLYPRLQETRQVNAATGQHALLLSKIRDFFADSSPAGLNTTNAVSAGIVQPNDLRSPWGGNITLGFFLANIIVSYDDLTPDRCKKLITHLEPQARGVSIGSTVIKNEDVAFNPLSINACNSVTPTMSVTFWEQP